MTLFAGAIASLIAAMTYYFMVIPTYRSMLACYGLGAKHLSECASDLSGRIIGLIKPETFEQKINRISAQ